VRRSAGAEIDVVTRVCAGAAGWPALQMEFAPRLHCPRSRLRRRRICARSASQRRRRMLKHSIRRIAVIQFRWRQDRWSDDARSDRVLGVRPVLGTQCSVRLENIGDTPVVNPWIQRQGKPDTRSLQSLVESLIRPEMSDKEKARRLWEFEIDNRFHATTQDDEVGDVVKRVNVYGYSLCYDASKDISDLWRAAGLRVRQGFPNGHSLAEVYYEGDCMSWIPMKRSSLCCAITRPLHRRRRCGRSRSDEAHAYLWAAG